MNSYIDGLVKSVKIPKATFLPWYHKVLELVKISLNSLSFDRPKNKLINPFKDESILNALNQVHDHFVCTPTDKCSNNVSFVCKRFYLECIHEELNKNFELVDKTESDIIEEHNTFLRDFNIRVDETDPTLPFLYSTAKQHKNPVKFRFITSTRNCSLKPLAVVLKHCFKSVQREIVKRCRYFDAKFKYTIKSCFISDNNVKVREDIYRLNTYFGSIDNVTSFDFETLWAVCNISTY